MERISLEGKVAVITGSNSGIGESTAKLFLRRGANVVLHGRNAEKLKKVKDNMVKELGKEKQVVAAPAGDVRDADVQKDLIETAIKTFGRLDILVNNAGFSFMKFIRDTTQQDLDDMYSIFLKAPVALSQLALPHLIKSKGNIVNISTGFTEEVRQTFFAVAAAYAANDTFTKYASVEFGHAGVRVNTVRAGIILTPGVDILLEERTKEIIDQCVAEAILNRNGDPDDMAEAIAYIASDAASFVTGAILDVDGGRLVYRDRSKKGDEPKYDDIIGQK